MMIHIYVGWDRREEIAYEVCRQSILENTHAQVKIIPLKLSELRAQQLYWRQDDPLASTEFTYSRFLVPYLMNYQGWAIFCDCDFLFTHDIQALFDLREASVALSCVHHDYKPKESQKMDGVPQTVYPRKNWSSLMLMNCSHPSNKVLTPAVVNSQTGAYLHRFQWLSDELIGSIPEEWNWLEGWSLRPAQGAPKGIHYTRGGPWFPNWSHVEYADLWHSYRERVSSMTPAQ